MTASATTPGASAVRTAHGAPGAIKPPACEDAGPRPTRPGTPLPGGRP
ncbi:hypothetical protein [uncultured Actinomyces sp.]|nr:hypothetical protein [uncultured Actinomyces sp.]